MKKILDMLPVLNPASPQAQSIYGLFMTMVVVSGIILLIVVGMVGISLIRYRRKDGAKDPDPTFGHKNLEIAWTVVPLLVVIWLFFLTLKGMQQSDPAHNVAPDIIVTGHQYWWEIRYPKSGVTTANEIHIPAGVNLLLGLESADVIHSFWVPQLARKMDCIPGMHNQIWLEADQPGTYQGFCSHYCGAQHAGMHFLVIAQSAEEYKAWEQQQLKPVPQTRGREAANGLKIFREMTCVSCHIPGNPVTVVGPDLNHFAARRTIGAGVLANNPQNLARWLENPQAVKPMCLMPKLKLSEWQVTELVAYLETLQ